jgi:SAM-dependent methyltransferase
MAGYTELNSRIRTRFSIWKQQLDPNSKYAFVKSLQSGQVVLDVGCGFDSARKLKSAAPALTYDGVDIEKYYMTEEGIRAMRNYYLFKRTSFNEQLKALDSGYEGIILSHVVEHVEEPLELMSILCDKLRVNGQLYVSTPYEGSVHFPKLKKGCLNFYDDPTHLRPFEISSFAQSLPKNIVVSKHIARNHGSIWLFALGVFLWPYTAITKRATPWTWYAYGFETVLILKKEDTHAC